MLANEGYAGEDVHFSITTDWLMVNHITNFGFPSDLVEEFASHMHICKSPECIEADKRLRAIYPFLQEGKLPGGPAIALLSAVEGKGHKNSVTLTREKGWGDVIDEIMPFINWFTGENRSFWKWPDE